MQRLIDCHGLSHLKISPKELLTSIRLSEGRTVVSEIICPQMPMLYDISNVELAAGFGADIILLNLYDVDKPFIRGLPQIPNASVINAAKQLSGRFIGVNLEPVDPVLSNTIPIEKGRIATIENVQKIVDQGAHILVLTGNPKVGVTHDSLIKCIRSIKGHFGDRIIVASGRMHSSGDPSAIGKGIINDDKLRDIIEAGSDIILLPSPGTVPGISTELLSRYIDICHRENKLVMTTIGTSQEGADTDTIKRIAFHSKEAGSDLHHIGDCGYGPGIAIPENIMSYSIAIKGRRHTYRRMTSSIVR